MVTPLLQESAGASCYLEGTNGQQRPSCEPAQHCARRLYSDNTLHGSAVRRQEADVIRDFLFFSPSLNVLTIRQQPQAHLGVMLKFFLAPNIQSDARVCQFYFSS